MAGPEMLAQWLWWFWWFWARPLVVLEELPSFGASFVTGRVNLRLGREELRFFKFCLHVRLRGSPHGSVLP